METNNSERARIIRKTRLETPEALKRNAEGADIVARFVEYAEDDYHGGGCFLEVYPWEGLDAGDNPSFEAACDDVAEAQRILADLLPEDIGFESLEAPPEDGGDELALRVDGAEASNARASDVVEGEDACDVDVAVRFADGRTVQAVATLYPCPDGGFGYGAWGTSREQWLEDAPGLRLDDLPRASLRVIEDAAIEAADRWGAARMIVVSIRQVDGAIRLVALTDSDADVVRRDRAMLDYVRPAAVLTITGTAREWGPRCTAEGRAAIELEAAR